MFARELAATAVLLLVGAAAAQPVKLQDLPVALRYVAKAHGQRFEKAGMERLIMQGTVSHNGEAETPIAIIHETPGRLRVEEQSKTLGVDAAGPWKNSGTFSDEETGLLESLLCDTLEEFFYAHAKGGRPRSLGSYFRMGEGAVGEYKGPYYNIYELMERQVEDGKVRYRLKRHFINSDTNLWEMARYTIERSGATVNVATKVVWRDQDAEKLPATITRTENDRTVFAIKVSTARLASATEDGIFDGSKGVR